MLYIIVGLVCIVTASILLFRLKNPNQPINNPRPLGNQSTSIQKRGSTSISRTNREVWFEQRGNESYFRMKSDKPVRGMQVYIKSGDESMFAYKVDEEDE